MSRLTKPLLEAMAEALVHRLAGEIGDESPYEEGIPQEHYDRALDWVCEQQRKRESRRHV